MYTCIHRHIDDDRRLARSQTSEFDGRQSFSAGGNSDGKMRARLILFVQ